MQLDLNEKIDIDCYNKFLNFSRFVKYDGMLHIISCVQDQNLQNSEKIDYWVSLEKDKGIYDGFNLGMKLSRGEYIGFLNSDDKFIYSLFWLFNHFIFDYWFWIFILKIFINQTFPWRVRF